MSAKFGNTMWFLGRRRFISSIKEFHSSRALGIAVAAEGKSDPKSTVDPDDVQRHTKLLKEWWDPNGPMKALHTYNLIRVPFIRDGLVTEATDEKTLTPLKGKTVLDVGCGGGILSEPLARLGAQVTGIDASCELIDLATKHSLLDSRLADRRPSYICSTVEEYVKSNEAKFDGVVASEIIEHVANPELFVKCCVAALKPGGRLFVTTPNRTKLARFAVIFVAENVLNLVPRGTHQFDKFLTPNELTFLLERNNCHVEITYGVMYNFVTNGWMFCSYKNFAFALQAMKLQ